jgi:hypothetical protein
MDEQVHYLIRYTNHKIARGRFSISTSDGLVRGGKVYN